jgi:hypothetical protein
VGTIYCSKHMQVLVEFTKVKNKNMLKRHLISSPMSQNQIKGDIQVNNAELRVHTDKYMQNFLL